MRSAELYSLYIHWPFCPYRCHYCPFVALAGQNEHMEEYHQALVLELKQWAANKGNCRIGTIYYGGGTPSMYPDRLLLDMSDTIRDVLDLHALEEVTIEINPGTVRQEQFAVWQKAGINRLSIGVQTLQHQLLKILNRQQTCADVTYLLANASRVFDNISVDLMLGLPGMTMEQWQSDLEVVVTWPIQHVSLYCLQLHETTPLYYKVQRGEVQLPDDDLVADCYSWAIEFLAQHGFMQYEVSNFAREQYESKHNCAYWERRPYKGIGLAACSFQDGARTQNESSLMKYVCQVKQGCEPIVFKEILSSEAVRLEKIMLGLRRTIGVSYDVILDGLTEGQQQRVKAKIDCLKQQGLVQEIGKRLVLTAAGFVVENEVIAELV